MAPKPGSRPIGAGWADHDPAPNSEGHYTVLILQVPIMVEWNEAQRGKAAQAAADAVLHAIYSMEQDGVKS